MTKKRTRTRSKRVTVKTAVPTKAEIMRALDNAQAQIDDASDKQLSNALAIAEVQIAEADVLDTALNFVQAWIAHPRDEKLIGSLHEVLVRNTLVMKYKRQVAAAQTWPVPTGPVNETDAEYVRRRGFVQRDVPRASRGLLRKRGRGISDVVAEREGVN